MELRTKKQKERAMNRLIRKAVWLAPLALLLWTLTAQASTQVGQALIKAADQNGQPVAGATVEPGPSVAGRGGADCWRFPEPQPGPRNSRSNPAARLTIQ